MSDEQAEQINTNTFNIEKVKVNATLVMWCSIFGFVILSIWILRGYIDDNKTDKANLNAKVEEIKAAQQRTKEELKTYLVTVVHAEFDSLKVIMVKNKDELNTQIQEQNRQIRYINEKCDRFQYYTEKRRYPGDKHPQVIPEPPSK